MNFSQQSAASGILVEARLNGAHALVVQPQGRFLTGWVLPMSLPGDPLRLHVGMSGARFLLYFFRQALGMMNPLRVDGSQVDMCRYLMRPANVPRFTEVALIGWLGHGLPVYDATNTRCQLKLP